MMATAKYDGSGTIIAGIVQNFHIQDQGKRFIERKSSSTPPQSHIVPPLPLYSSKENPPGASEVS
jgi:hypothetical protein